MKTLKRFILSLAILGGALILTYTGSTRSASPARAQAPSSSTAASREEAYRANNLGVAMLEQFKHKEGAEQFARALKIDPMLAVARANLSIALYNVPDLAGAQREAQAAAALNPNAPQPFYVLGMIAKTQNRADEAVAAFQRVLKIDPGDVGANVNLGQLYAQQLKYAEAIAVFRTALLTEPYNTTALYNLATSLIRGGDRAEGQKLIQLFQEIRRRGSGTTIGTTYLEQGRYAEATASTGLEPDLVDKTTPAAGFTDATAATISPAPAADTGAGAPVRSIIGRRFKASEFGDNARRDIAAALGQSVLLFDYDADNDLDLLQASGSELRLYRNDGGKLTDATAQSGALAAKTSGAWTASVAGDYDNDGRPDLFLMRDTGGALFHNDGGGKFSDATRTVGLPSYPYLSASVAFLDADHDGDLDIFVAGLADLSKPLAGKDTFIFPEDFNAAPGMLWRNDGNGKFTDVTTDAKLGAPSRAFAVVPTDFNNKRDVDLLVVNYNAAPDLYSNQRDGSFKNVTRDVGLDVSGRWTSAAAGDYNKDGFTDFFFGRADGAGLFATSDGRGRFTTNPAPDGTERTTAAQFLDYDGDGLLDCATFADGSLKVWRNVGDGWANVSERAVARDLSGKAAAESNELVRHTFASGDIEADGDVDLFAVAPAGALRVALGGGGVNRSLRVNLAGRVSNRSAIGAKVEVRAGSLVQKLETYSASPAPAPADIQVGLGKRQTADAVRVLWPAGIVQAETEIAAPPTGAGKNASASLSITELDRKPSSCPYLYAWNGERFAFVTDFMGGGEIGYWVGAGGRYNTPDPVEYVRIRGDGLKPRAGRYELRISNELEEAVLFDRLQLVAVAHLEGTEVYPNEGMTSAPLPPFKLYTTKGARPPLAAYDERGDVLARVAALDREFVEGFPLDAIRGYAAKHSLTLKLAEESAMQSRLLLLLTGWTDYAFSSDNVAAAQAGKTLRPPALQVKNARGEWQTVIENIGIPVGRPQTVPVDLTGKFLTTNREVRIVTNMRIYWDQVLVDTSSTHAPVRMTRLDPAVADLRWRGYSAEETPDGREPFTYAYERVSYTSPWKVMPGRYTREGDVRKLLRTTDDMFVITRPGDEIILSFDANKLPPLPAGWTRTFLLYADGFSKEMDINSATPDGLEPLPFHGMTRYPYSAPEAYPLTPARRAYLERYNTRIVRGSLPQIETVFAEDMIFNATRSLEGEK
ncbi:MAG TPA: FG-GAP-like repeat-containing protein [Pyrinomonadaceae bacterium]|jgi:tetratricopeptide (TPR) repeat protein